MRVRKELGHIIAGDTAKNSGKNTIFNGANR
jgi:hypothetical protein